MYSSSLTHGTQGDTKSSATLNQWSCVTCCCRKEFQMDEAVEKFAIYDNWADFEYKFSMQVRYQAACFSVVVVTSGFYPSRATCL